MKLITKQIEKKLHANYTAMMSSKGKETGQWPVLKLFGGPNSTWLISEMDENGLMFGLCDLGMGCPELGYVSLEELQTVRFPPFGLPVERDRFFRADRSLLDYAADAREHSGIVA